MKKKDIPLDQAVALVRACQKLNCDTADQLFAMVERRCSESAALHSALKALKEAVEKHGTMNGREFNSLGVQVNNALLHRSA
jgi:hypothetical protein